MRLLEGVKHRVRDGEGKEREDEKEISKEEIRDK